MRIPLFLSAVFSCRNSRRGYPTASEELQLPPLQVETGMIDVPETPPHHFYASWNRPGLTGTLIVNGQEYPLSRDLAVPVSLDTPPKFTVVLRDVNGNEVYRKAQVYNPDTAGLKDA